MNEPTLKSLQKRESKYNHIRLGVFIPLITVTCFHTLYLLFHLTAYTNTEKFFAIFLSITFGSIGFFGFKHFTILKSRAANDFRKLYNQKLDKAKEINKKVSV